MSSALSKIDYCYIRFWSTILLLIAIIPGITLAQESFDITKNSTTVILSAPDTIKEFLVTYFKLPAEPFADSTAEKTFLYRAQKEIRSLLATEGYFSPVISSSHQTQGEVTKPEIRVDPGVVTRIGEVSIVFRGEIIQEDAKYQKRIEQLRAAWPLQAGSPFRSSEWEQAKATLLSELTQEDFAAANIVTSQATIDPDHARADLSVTIDSGPVFYLGAIQITGLERYDQTLITNLAPFKIGDAYRRDLLNLFQIALQKAPQFNTISVNISPDTSQHKSIPVQVVLTEAQSQRFAFGGGYSSNNGARGEINYRNHNFLDRAWNLTSMLRLEQKRQTFFAGIDTLPDQNNINYSLITSLQMTDIQNLKTNEQKIGMTRNYQTPEIQMQFGLNWQRENKQPAGAINQINEALTLDWRWRRQIVDDPLNIRRGNVTEIRIGGGSQQLLSTQDFVRTYARHQIWWPVGSQDVIFLRAEIGYTLASSRFGIPQEYLFRAGGIQSVRGYDFKSIGVQEGNAIVGGRTMATGTIEYTRWITHQWGAAAFADIGSAADSWQKMHPFIGYGGGIRWRSPAGPIALDLARAHETGTLRFHFSMAVAF
ncbi:autotransporter assembly complex family protein [Nitrosomonas sp.]|uniref:autotransporter assembly complex protein TamA n=1 Tax=Nitrosomonas sp. TaxID=42353 RepID=UPI0025DF3EE5|nr:autotransporter assembly complex family protein [Nitrosomonas sp.]MBY0483097.1 autotransporter assembly complex protein TamA [Nitrosomonas sp.]